ncbi:MAG TPA: hypothetical protein VG795_12910 [Acidimicrobiia bacterium]|nr:hypothetical protein [Acidimicrobiia bacterium]
MSSLLRRVARSKTSVIASTGALGLTRGVPAAAASPARPDFVAQAACSGSTVTREYTTQAMTFRLQLDLDGCGWWDGSARNLMIWLSRDDGTGTASRYSMTTCESGSDPASRTTACEVMTTLSHPTEERAVTYQGEATWEWQDGTRRVSFDTHCTTETNHARCDDPVAIWRDTE